MNLKEIDSRLEELKTQLDQYNGKQTEVYSRIVGYYRSVKNWNKGKKEEFNIRKTYEVRCHPDKVEAPKTLDEKEVIQVSFEESNSSIVEEENKAGISAEVIEAKGLKNSVELNKVDAPSEDKSLETSEDASQGDLFSSNKDEKTEALEPGYRFYFRKDCPNCPPMKAFVETLDLSGEYVNVDEEEGLQKAVEDNVYTAPTVILLDGDKKETFRTDNVKGLDEFLNKNKEVAAL